MGAESQNLWLSDSLMNAEEALKGTGTDQIACLTCCLEQQADGRRCVGW